jgi:TonB family protein
MIPRILVPKGARPPAIDAPSTRRRPSTLDERTLVPSTLPIVALDGHTTIPTNLPLDSIAARVVVPRDVNVELVQKRDDSTLPLQPTDLDERITIPQGAIPPQELPELPPISEELVEPNIIQTGEAAFLSPERLVHRSLEERITTATSVVLHIVFILFLIFEPTIFKPHVRTNEEEDIARRQMTVLLPPGTLEALKPTPRAAPPPHPPMNVDPRVLRRVAPPIESPPIAPPQPEPPKKELPSAPTPQPNTVMPTPQPNPSTSKGDFPKTPTKLETPDMPVPEKGLILPKQTSPGDTIRDAARQSGKMNAPVPIMGGGQLPPGSGGGGGSGRGTAAAGIEMLTDTEGVDFNDYLRRVYIAVRNNWYAVMPASVQLGDQGVVSLQFKIMRNGGVPDGEPVQVFSSGKEPLDRAAFSSIRASNPFPQLPPQFKGPYIELRFTYYYNLRPPNN